MIEVVYNARSGGAYGLSKEACEYLGLDWQEELRKKMTDSLYFPSQICARPFEHDRANPRLVECVRTLGAKASAEFAKLEIYVDEDATDFIIMTCHCGEETVVPICYPA